MPITKEEVRNFSATLQAQAIDDENLIISFVALSQDNLHKRQFYGEDYYLSVDTKSAKWNAKTFYLDHEVSFANAIGKISEVKFENGAFKVRVKFFEEIPQSMEAFTKYKNGLSRSVSVGFGACDLVELEPINGIPHFEIQNGEIIELSAVWLGADKNAKISKWNKDRQMQNKNQNTLNPLMDENAKLKEENESLKLQASKASETKEILELGKITGKELEASQAIIEGKSLAEFRGSLLSAQSSPSILQSPKSSKSSMTHSLANYVKGVSLGSQVGEVEFSNGANGGVLIPNSFYDRFNAIKSNDGGVEGIINRDFRGDKFIEALITSSDLLKKCDHLSDLVGEQQIPRDNSNIEAQWVNEGDTPAGQSIQTDSILMRPNCLRAMITITRTMLSMSPLALESYIIRRLKQAMLLKLEETLLYGNGNPIKGVFNVDGVQAISGYFTDTDYKKTLDFKAKLGSKNFSLKNISFAGNIATQSILQSTLKDSTGVSGYLMNEAGNRLAGIPYEVSGLIKDNHLLFGDFKNILIGTWGSELEVQAIKDTGGNITFTAFKDVDIKLKRNDAFVVAKS